MVELSGATAIPLGTPHLVGHLSGAAVGGDQRDGAAGRFLTAHQVEACLVDVGVTPTIDDDLVPCRAKVRKVGVPNQEPAGFLTPIAL
jgi:hypothetical protein